MMKLGRKTLLAMLLASILTTSVLLPTLHLHLHLSLSPTSSSDTAAIISDILPTLPLATRHHLSLVRDSDSDSASGSDHRNPTSHLQPPLPTDSVLLPEWESLVLLPPNSPFPSANLSCLFRNAATSPARFVGTVRPNRPAFICPLPHSVRRLKPLFSPHLIGPSEPPLAVDGGYPPPPEMLRWSHLAYDSFSAPRDVIVLAKGINTRQFQNLPPSSLRCLFTAGGAAAVSTAATSSNQEVFRCAHPPQDFLERVAGQIVRVSLQVAGDPGAVPSLATYNPPETATKAAHAKRRSLVCACTMVYNVAKFLPEWVRYHAAVGVDRFILYDNGSEDGLRPAVARLNAAGFNVSTRFWPWPKTQEAGFSHCAAAHVGDCEWMAFIDVDEFLFSPAWSGSPQPNRTMIGSLLPSDAGVGQVNLGCRDFGPSGQRAHPKAGVTQGYTCRKRAEERHKSLVRLKAVAGGSLVNSVHHFGDLDRAWATRKDRSGRVYHYKYQAWPEFEGKFRRRVSAYVADWRQAVNPTSNDRTPGLGFEPVEPEGWPGRFCEVNDTAVRDVSRRWFGREGPTAGEYKMVWEE